MTRALGFALLLIATQARATGTIDPTTFGAFAHATNPANTTTGITLNFGIADPNDSCENGTNATVDGACNTCAGYSTLITTTGATAPYCNHESIVASTPINFSVSTNTTAQWTNASQVQVIAGTTTTGACGKGFATGAVTTGGAISIQMTMGELCQILNQNLSGADSNYTAPASGAGCLTQANVTLTFNFSVDGQCGAGTTNTTPTASPTPTSTNTGVTSGIADSVSLIVNIRNMDQEIADAGAGNASTIVNYASNCTANGGGSVANEGVCGFSIGDGDGKVFINNVLVPLAGGAGASSWPATGSQSGITWAGFELYYTPIQASEAASNETEPQDADWANINPSGSDNITGSSGLISVDANGNVAQDIVDGLGNGNVYTFVSATVDQAGNESYFSYIGDYAAPTAGDFFDPANGRHWGAPGAVVGLLSGKSCFIATAAYGSPMEAHVSLLRNFRDRFLLKSTWGRSFVRTYYRLSPPLANFIAQHETLRAVTRVALWPLVFFAEFAMKRGFFQASALVFVALLVAGLTFISGRRGILRLLDRRRGAARAE